MQYSRRDITPTGWHPLVTRGCCFTALLGHEAVLSFCTDLFLRIRQKRAWREGYMGAKWKKRGGGRVKLQSWRRWNISHIQPQQKSASPRPEVTPITMVSGLWDSVPCLHTCTNQNTKPLRPLFHKWNVTMSCSYCSDVTGNVHVVVKRVCECFCTEVNTSYAYYSRECNTWPVLFHVHVTKHAVTPVL